MASGHVVTREETGGPGQAHPRAQLPSNSRGESTSHSPARLSLPRSGLFQRGLSSWKSCPTNVLFHPVPLWVIFAVCPSLSVLWSTCKVCLTCLSPYLRVSSENTDRSPGVWSEREKWTQFFFHIKHLLPGNWYSTDTAKPQWRFCNNSNSNNNSSRRRRAVCGQKAEHASCGGEVTIVSGWSRDLRWNGCPVMADFQLQEITWNSSRW